MSPNWCDSYFSMISYPWFDLTFTKLLKLEFSGSAPDSNLYCFYSSIFSFALKRGVPCYMITILPHNAQAVKAKIQGAIPGWVIWLLGPLTFNYIYVYFFSPTLSQVLEFDFESGGSVTTRCVIGGWGFRLERGVWRWRWSFQGGLLPVHCSGRRWRGRDSRRRGLADSTPCAGLAYLLPCLFQGKTLF